MGMLALASSVVMVIMAVQTVTEGRASQSSYKAHPGCEEGYKSPDSPIATLSVSTPSKCALACLKTESCLAYNVCYNTKGFSCNLLPFIKLNSCSGLVSEPDCSYREKELMPCQNGGIRSPTGCACAEGYTGSSCESYFRSCKDLKDHNVQTSNYYMIQPLGSTVAYRVYCNLQYSKTAYFFVRKRHVTCPWINYDMSWDDYKNGWGDVNCGEYFLGLETLYQLMKYEEFQVHAHGYIGWNAIDYFYSNFTVQSEAENYRMNYDSGFNFNANHGNILGSEKPRDFCTRDRDCGSCAASKGGGWWYSSGCGGNHMTSSLADFVWPVLSGEDDLASIYLQLDHMNYL